MSFGWIFYPNYDGNGMDITHIGQEPVRLLMNIAESIDECYSFNTNGWLKTASNGFNPVNYSYPRGGVYTKVSSDYVINHFEEIRSRNGVLVDKNCRILGLENRKIWSDYPEIVGPVGFEDDIDYYNDQMIALNSNNPTFPREMRSPQESNPAELQMINNLVQGMHSIQINNGNIINRDGQQNNVTGQQNNNSTGQSNNHNNVQISPIDEKFIAMMEHNYDDFREIFDVKSIDGLVLQTIGSISKLILSRDDKNLKYSKIIVINPGANADVEKDLSRIFYKKYILTTLSSDKLNFNNEIGYNNISPGNIDETLLQNLSPSEGLRRTGGKKKALLIVNTDISHLGYEKTLLKNIPKYSANISQLILNVHNVCIGNIEEVEGLFAILEYLSQDYIVTAIQEYEHVKFGQVKYPKHISVTYINRNVYPRSSIRDKKDGEIFV